MNAFAPFRSTPPTTPAPLVLLVEDDPSVLQVLHIALTQQHYRVVTAIDGDEALRRASAERPDVVVCDVRLPRRSGLEVCDHLRHDPEDPQVPILLLSASGDTDARLEGLARGADDYLAKPFSPKELIARIQRLLVRSGEARQLRRRAAELERELGRAQTDARRAQGDARRESRLRELAVAAGRELHRTLDPDELQSLLLRQAQQQLGCEAVMLLLPEYTGEERRFVAAAGRGAAAEVFSRASFPATGELAALLSGLGRPVSRAELERFAELREELAPFVAAGAGWFAPLRGARGLEGVLVAGERVDTRPLETADREALAMLCEFAAAALANAMRYTLSQDRSLELLAEHPCAREDVRDATHEALRVSEAAAHALALPAGSRHLLRHAVRFGAWGWSDECARQLQRIESRDATQRISRLRALMRRGEALEAGEELDRATRHTTLVLAVSVRYLVARVGGRSIAESVETALVWAGPHLDAEARAAVERAFASATPEFARSA